MFDDKRPQDANLTPELAALERQLAGLQLAPAQTDRDQLMFAAGRAAAIAEYRAPASHRGAGANGWFWPSATALMTAACVMLAAMLVWQDDETSVATDTAKPQAAIEQLADQPTSGDFNDVERLTSRFASSPSFKRPRAGYLGVRYVALTEGIEATTPTHTATDNENSYSGSNPGEPDSSPSAIQQPLRVRSLNPRIRS